MPSVLCSNCSKKYRVDDAAAGKKFACKQCGSVVRVPALAVAAVPVAAARMPAARQPAPPAVTKRPAPPPSPEPALLEEQEGAAGELDFNDMASLETTGEVDNSIPVTDEAPAPTYKATRAATKPKAAKKFSPPRIGFRLNRGVLIVIGLGVAATVWGGREWMLASSASDKAQDITCADLSMNGPGDNAHVRITDFYASSYYIAQKNQKTGDLESVWYPIIPPNSFTLPPDKKLKDGARIVPDTMVNSGQIHVLIKTHTAKSEGDVTGAMNRPSVEGLVINKIEKLNQQERDLLHTAYPAFSEDSCYIVEDGRQPQGGLGMFAVLGGVLLALYGLFLMFKPST